MIGAKIGLSQFGPGAIFSQPMQSGRYYFVPNYIVVTTSATSGNGTLRVAPFWVPNTITVQRIGGEVTSAGDVGSTVRFGIYNDDGTNRPGTLLADSGTINGNTVAVQEITGLSITLTPGVYWIAGVVQGVVTTQPTLRFCTVGGMVPGIDAGTTIPAAGTIIGGYSQTGVTGALPATFTSTTAAGGPIRTFIKVN